MATTFAVPDGRVAMAATTYTGNATAGTNISNTVNAVSMQPDFVWIKNRTGANDNILTDSVRGVTKTLISNSTSAELTIAGALTAFNSGGFQIGYDGTAIVNATSNNYVGWQWKAGGTAVSNTAGTITSSVSANTTAGFSVVTYTGNGVNSTMGHGLGVAPAMIFYKSRSLSVDAWIVYHSALAVANNLVLSNTNLQQPNGIYYWNSTAPTNTLIRAGIDANNYNGATYVAYCWAPVAGYSAFGSYAGNSLDDGPFVYTGFRPRWLLIKNSTTGASSWYLFDTARNSINVSATSLYPEASYAEGVSSVSILDILSNGFKLRGISGGTNGVGNTYIYAAFAENPLKFSNAR